MMSLANIKGVNYNINPKKLIKVFLVLMVFELVVGGGGRFFEVGPVTVRMLFYFLAIFISIFQIYLDRSVNRYVIKFTILYTILLGTGILVGVINGSPINLILEDIKPLIFFYVLPFFSSSITNRADIELIGKVIKGSSLILAVFYILILILIVTRVINFIRFYALVEPYGEVMFRGESFFFYKGFLFLCIGFFFTLQPGKLNKVYGIILLSAIILTLTRGFILTVFIVTLLYLIFIYKNKLLSVGLLFGAISVFILALPFYLQTVGDRSGSDVIRIIQAEQVWAKTNLFNFFIGDGFGHGIPIRPIHMEISYLEIFSKQGVFGLAFWLAILVYISYKFFFSVSQQRNKEFLAPFYLSVVFVYLQSLTNPFINNPIGMSMVLISLTVFHVKSL